MAGKFAWVSEMIGRKKPLVIVTRKLPDTIETRMRELFDARLNIDDKPFTPAQLVEAVKTADVLVPDRDRPHRQGGARADG